MSFAKEFDGTLATETMLVDGESALRRTAALLDTVDPDVPHVAVPTRPPAEDWVVAVDETAVGAACRLFAIAVDDVEYRIGVEPDDFATTGDIEANILGVTAGHSVHETGLKDSTRRREPTGRSSRDYSTMWR